MKYEDKVFEVAKAIFAAKHAYFNQSTYDSKDTQKIFDEAQKFVIDWNKYKKKSIMFSL